MPAASQSVGVSFLIQIGIMGCAQIPGLVFFALWAVLPSRWRYYQVGETGKPVLILTGKKTLSELEVEALKALGCELVFVDGPKVK